VFGVHIHFYIFAAKDEEAFRQRRNSGHNKKHVLHVHKPNSTNTYLCSLVSHRLLFVSQMFAHPRFYNASQSDFPKPLQADDNQTPRLLVVP
jgi:hypothetical protein